MLHHGNLARTRLRGRGPLHHFDPPHYLPHLLLQGVNLLLLGGELFVGTDDFRIFLLQLGFQFLIQALDGGQGHALGIGCANGLVVIAEVKSRVEILGHGAEVLAAAGIRALLRARSLEQLQPPEEPESVQICEPPRKVMPASENI